MTEKQVLKHNKFNVGDIVEVVNMICVDDKNYLGKLGKVMYVDPTDNVLSYKVAFFRIGNDWFNGDALRKHSKVDVKSGAGAGAGAECITKIKTIQESAGHWESFDERVNEFMQDKDVIDVSHSFVTDISGLENIIAVITYRCSKTEE